MQTIKLTPLEQPVTATVDIPGSKSVTNRALIMGAVTENSVTLVNPLWSDDTEAMMDCLQTMGIAVEKRGHDISIRGSIRDVKDGMYDLNARFSGTTIRFILALSCIVPGVKTVHGTGRLNERPIRDLVDALYLLGADIKYAKKDEFPPVIVQSSQLHGGIVEMKGDTSSQFISALLMLAPVIGGLQIELTTPQISRSYIDLTIKMMTEWGIDRIKNQDYRTYSVEEGQQYQVEKYIIEGDYSGAAYFAAIAALTQSTITLKNLKGDSTQGDRVFLQILEQMGNTVLFDDTAVIVKGTGVKPVTVDMEICPDQAQTLAVLAAFAEGKTVITGVRSLRVKETERVQAVQQELKKMGIRTESPDQDTLIVHGGNPKAAPIDTYGDHRMAMSFAVAGAAIPGMKIHDPDVVNKTFPAFWNKLNSIGI